MMTTSLLIGERGEEVFSEARLPAGLAKGVGFYSRIFSCWDGYIRS
jgi:hypothetical protein